MASRQKREPFYIPSNFVARKTFTYNGEVFEQGDEFPYEDLGVDERKLRDMYVAGYLMRDHTSDEDRKYDDAVTGQGAEKRKLSRAEKRALKKSQKKVEEE